jgi:molecular chaperone GrpE
VTDEHGRRIPIVDKRVSSRDAQTPPTPAPGMDEDGTATPSQAQEVAEDPQTDFLDDLKRLQADFDNYRKRMMREQAVTAGRAKARLMEQMLPVLDAFDRALEHDDGASGMELIFKQLGSTLEAEGLEEIPAEGVPFDPHVHDAVDSREDPDVQEIVTRSVYRRGYKIGEQVLRPATVVVARPPDVSDPESSEVAEG